MPLDDKTREEIARRLQKQTDQGNRDIHPDPLPSTVTKEVRREHQDTTDLDPASTVVRGAGFGKADETQIASREPVNRSNSENGSWSASQPPSNPQEPQIINGVYIPEKPEAQKRLWVERLEDLACKLIRDTPSYQHAYLTVNDVREPIRQEMLFVTTAEAGTAYTAFRKPDWIDDDTAWALMGNAVDVGFEVFRRHYRNDLTLENGKDVDTPKPKPPKRGKSAMAVEPKKVEWLWPGYIPLGKLCDIQGDPGQGKSAVTANLAAIITSGGLWPTGEQCEAGGVIMVSGEDDLDDTIVPRLIAAGANRERVYTYTLQDEILFELPRDLDLLAEKAKEGKVRAIIIDPLDCFVSDELEMNKGQSIRKLLAALARFAAESSLAIIIIRHLNKDAKTKVPMYRGVGSIGLNAASRQVFMVGPAPDDKNLHVLAHVKGNCGPQPESLGYRLEGVKLEDYPDIETVKVNWTGKESFEAFQLLGEQDKQNEKTKPPTATLQAATEALRAILADGFAHASTEVEEQLEAQGFKHGMIWKAKDRLGVKASQKGFHGGWSWTLPGESVEY